MIRMFQQDSRATKIVFGVVIGFAIIAMVVTLVPGIFDNGAANNSALFATVRSPGFLSRFSGDSTEITNVQVENLARRQLRQQQMPDTFLPFVLARAGQAQVERAVLIREADHLGLEVSNDDVRRELQNGPLGQYLFPGGQFIGTDRYEDFVSQYFQTSVVNFESQVKQDIELQRLEALVTGGATVSDATARADYLKQGERVKFDYAVISLDDIKKTISPTDAELQKYFNANTARYATAVPEQRKIQFFAVDTSNLPGGVPKVSDADIQAYYNAHQADYQIPQEVKTRHILIAVPRGADAKTDAAAKAKAEDVLKQLQAGANFADLAKKYSDDPGSKNSGGELPLMPTSNLDPAYAKAAMALNPGQTSGLVRSQFGYHIIQTEEKQAAHTKSLAEVHDEIAGKLSAQRVAQVQTAFADQLATEAKSKGMEATAKEHNLQLVTTDFLPKTGTISTLPDSAALLAAAFGTAKGAAPQSVSTGDGYAVFQVVAVQPAHAPAFADWKSHVLDDYRADKAPDLLNVQLKKLDDRAKQLGDLKKAAAEMNIPVKSSDLVGRDAQVQDLGALTGAAEAVFTLPKGGITGPVDEGPNGAVLQVVDQQQPTPDDVNQHLAATKDKLLEAQRNEIFNVFAAKLMDRYERAGAIIYSRKPTGLPLGS